MNEILVVYRSKKGFTKKYVKWISESIKSQVVSLDHVDNIEVANYNIIVYGAGVHAGKIHGLNEFKKRVKSLESNKIIIFATGGAPLEEDIIATLRSNNPLLINKSSDSIFYFQSGINYERMGKVDKALMKTYGRILSLKGNKSVAEKETSKALLESYDYSCKESIEPLIDYLNQLLIKN